MNEISRIVLEIYVLTLQGFLSIKTLVLLVHMSKKGDKILHHVPKKGVQNPHHTHSKKVSYQELFWKKLFYGEFGPTVHHFLDFVLKTGLGFHHSSFRTLLISLRLKLGIVLSSQKNGVRSSLSPSSSHLCGYKTLMFEG